MKALHRWFATLLLLVIFGPPLALAGSIPIFGIQMHADGTTGATKINKLYGTGTTGDLTTVIEFAADGDRAFVDIPFSPYATSASTNSVSLYYTTDETDATKRACFRIQACALLTGDDIGPSSGCPALTTSASAANSCDDSFGSPSRSTCFIRALLSGVADPNLLFVSTTSGGLGLGVVTGNFGLPALCQIGSPPNCVDTTIRLVIEDDRASNANCTNDPVYLQRANFNYPQS